LRTAVIKLIKLLRSVELETDRADELSTTNAWVMSYDSDGFIIEPVDADACMFFSIVVQ
jgi:hypothetical protein